MYNINVIKNIENIVLFFVKMYYFYLWLLVQYIRDQIRAFAIYEVRNHILRATFMNIFLWTVKSHTGRNVHVVDVFVFAQYIRAYILHILHSIPTAQSIYTASVENVLPIFGFITKIIIIKTIHKYKNFKLENRIPRFVLGHIYMHE